MTHRYEHYPEPRNPESRNDATNVALQALERRAVVRNPSRAPSSSSSSSIGLPPYDSSPVKVYSVVAKEQSSRNKEGDTGGVSGSVAGHVARVEQVPLDQQFATARVASVARVDVVFPLEEKEKDIRRRTSVNTPLHPLDQRQGESETDPIQKVEMKSLRELSQEDHRRNAEGISVTSPYREGDFGLVDRHALFDRAASKKRTQQRNPALQPAPPPAVSLLRYKSSGPINPTSPPNNQRGGGVGGGIGGGIGGGVGGGIGGGVGVAHYYHHYHTAIGKPSVAELFSKEQQPPSHHVSPNPPLLVRKSGGGGGLRLDAEEEEGEEGTLATSGATATARYHPNYRHHQSEVSTTASDHSAGRGGGFENPGHFGGGYSSPNPLSTSNQYNGSPIRLLVPSALGGSSKKGRSSTIGNNIDRSESGRGGANATVPELVSWEGEREFLFNRTGGGGHDGYGGESSVDWRHRDEQHHHHSQPPFATLDTEDDDILAQWRAAQVEDK